MKRVVIVQARMTSTRLPGKVLVDLAGRPLLAQQLRRLRRCRDVDEIAVATTLNAADDPVAELARSEGAAAFRGGEADVLGRFVGAARERRADVVVRVTGDCPLVDPEVTDRVIRELVDHPGACDYASNVVERTYPRGLDVEAFTIEALLRMDRLGTTALEREHVTLGPRSAHRGAFLSRSVTDSENNADLRFTVDTPADLELVRRLYADLDLAASAVSYRRIVAHVRAHPELARLNASESTWSPP